MTNTAPIFILTGPRFGSTLLRVLLDSHPALACPPEAHVSVACDALEFLWKATAADDVRLPVSDDAVTRIAETVSEPMERYANQRGKARWCEKSITSIQSTDLLVRLFPDAQFICLYRQCLDAVISGIDASRWGFGAYGYEPYVRAFPSNIVEALTNHWCDYVDKLRAFESANASRCVSLRYEDLVDEPVKELQRVGEFLGVEFAAGAIERTFEDDHDFGGGDHKILFTDRILTSSVGAGRRVPLFSLSEPLLVRVNSLLADLRYDLVDADWNLGSSMIVPSGSSHRPAVDEFALATFGARALQAQPPSPCDHTNCLFLTVEDLGVTWHLDRSNRAASIWSDVDRPHTRSVIADSISVRDALSSSINLASSIRSGHIRSAGGLSAATEVLSALRTLRSNDAPEEGHSDV